MASRPDWAALSDERKAPWLADADAVIPIVVEACSRVARQRDPLDPKKYLVKRTKIAHVMRSLFVDERGWECPLEREECHSNCGDYGCGN